MAHEHHDHKGLISGITDQMKDLLAYSDHGMYIYLDDAHKVCNKKFSSMLGYKSPQDWAKVDESFPVAFVAEKSHTPLITAYKNAMEKGKGSSVKVTWKKKPGAKVNSNVILDPIMYNGHALGLQLASK